VFCKEIHSHAERILQKMDNLLLTAFLESVSNNVKAKSEMTAVILEFAIMPRTKDGQKMPKSISDIYHMFEIHGMPVVRMNCEHNSREDGSRMRGKISVLGSVDDVLAILKGDDVNRFRFFGQELILPVSESLRMHAVSSNLAKDAAKLESEIINQGKSNEDNV
jgi:hypothetical protein